MIPESLSGGASVNFESAVDTVASIVSKPPVLDAFGMFKEMSDVISEQSSSVFEKSTFTLRSVNDVKLPIDHAIAFSSIRCWLKSRIVTEVMAFKRLKSVEIALKGKCVAPTVLHAQNQSI